MHKLNILDGRFTVEDEFIRMCKAVAMNHFKGLSQHLSGCSKLQTHILLKYGTDGLLTCTVKLAKATGRNWNFYMILVYLIQRKGLRIHSTGLRNSGDSTCVPHKVHKYQAARFCKVVPNICGSSL
jgi:hypothetical protein